VRGMVRREQQQAEGDGSETPRSGPTKPHRMPFAGNARSNSSDIVITMIGNLGMQVASRFVRSLRETSARCHVVLVLPLSESSRELVQALSEWGVVPHFYETTRPPYAEMRGNRAKLIRYWAALEFLQQLRRGTTMAAAGVAGGGRGGRVLLADSRDVIFQRDPFTIPADPQRPLDIFLEDYLRNFANSGINQGHVVPCFGREAVRKTFLSPPRPVSCSGVTLGTRSAIIKYLRAMWNEMRQPQYTAECLQHDQAFHNYLLWSGRLSDAVGGIRAFSNEEGPITTIGWPQHLYRDRFGRVLNRKGDLVHVVHQYDRRKRLLASLGQRYALVKLPEQPPRTPAEVDTTVGLGRGWPSR
jgi:hypothetical protein